MRLLLRLVSWCSVSATPVATLLANLGRECGAALGLTSQRSVKGGQSEEGRLVSERSVSATPVRALLTSRGPARGVAFGAFDSRSIVRQQAAQGGPA